MSKKTKQIIVINGPNLNNLGKRNNNIYGNITLKDIENKMLENAKNTSHNLSFFQSNHEGAIVDFIQTLNKNDLSGIIINAGALSQVGYSILDALIDLSPIEFIEVHISNVYSREEFRQKSVFAKYASGQICGLGSYGYIAAMNYFIINKNEEY
ncbi:MAG: 3-dehydroquinate dehydratase [Chloroflexi bacterium]|nr:3-dehydroquinate dehydratase [Chloroflexota bacterium]